jgi:hypothetical protein
MLAWAEPGVRRFAFASNCYCWMDGQSLIQSRFLIHM